MSTKVEKALSKYKRSKPFQQEIYNKIMNAFLKGKKSVSINKRMTDESATKLSNLHFGITPISPKPPLEIKYAVDWVYLSK